MDLDRGFKLGEWTILPRQSSLGKAGTLIHIEPKVMGVLVCLAKHAPETATRDEIFDEVWRDTVVQDEALTRNIHVLRTNLEDEEGDRKYIQTVPRVGYRLLEPVTPLNDDEPAIRRSRPLIAGITIAAILIAAFFLTRGTVPSLDPDYTFSITDFSGPVDEPRDLNSALRSTRLTSQILMLGGASMLKRGAKDLQISIRLFEEGLKNEDNLPEVRLGLANAYALLPSYDATVDDQLMYARARAELEAAIALGIEPERTYATEAFIHLRRLEWIRAEEKFRQAIEYDPNDAHLRQWYAQFLGRVGFIQASIEQAQISLRLDPGSPVANHRLGASYTWADENELAEEQFTTAIRMGIAPYTYKEPKLVLLWRAGRYDELAPLATAVQEYQSYNPDWIPLFIEAMNNPGIELQQETLAALDQAWDNDQLSPTFYFGVSFMLNQHKKTLVILNKLLKDGSITEVVEALFTTELRKTRAEPGFLTLVREIGLDVYWNTYGLPDVCRGQSAETQFCSGLTLKSSH
jgi:DNA-binding winged helix-turn-helix (wHTH) protein/tetratricopeptide (TPR) repeat protein